MKRQLSQSEVYFELDLVELFGETPPIDVALSFGQDVIDAILERTESGIDRNDRRFARYSKEYVESDAFQDFRKSPSDVNLKLTGNMLSQLDIVQLTSDTIRIGVRDSGEAPKAFNHITGDTVPARDFLGLPDDEIDIIAERYRTDQLTGEIFNTLGELGAPLANNTELNNILLGLLDGEN